MRKRAADELQHAREPGQREHLRRRPVGGREPQEFLRTVLKEDESGDDS